MLLEVNLSQLFNILKQVHSPLLNRDTVQFPSTHLPACLRSDCFSPLSCLLISEFNCVCISLAGIMAITIKTINRDYAVCLLLVLVLKLEAVLIPLQLLLDDLKCE